MPADQPPPGWERARDCSVSNGKANLLAILFIVPLAVLPSAAFAARWGMAHFLGGFQSVGALTLLAAVVVGVVAHEVIHGITWALAGGKPHSSIRYGFKLSTITPYAHSTEPLSARAYIIGALMPGFLLGVVPALWAIAAGAAGLMPFALTMIALAGGDALIVWLLRRVPCDALVQDHPARAGCWVLEPTVGKIA